ncbi:MAG: hypothetical protein IJX52_02535, partial [Oscillibacter sp.]|nr:hypothetical protein [Oscillibacter sp.]
MNDYAKLMELIPVPEGLSGRVLSHAPRKRSSFRLPAAVCALLALAVVSAPALRSPEAQSAEP